MKILIISARYYPEQFSIVNICEHLVKRGNSVTVLTGKPNYGQNKIIKGYENVAEEIINNVKVFRVKEKARTKGFFGLLKNYISIFFAFNNFLKRHRIKYDVIVSHVVSPIFTMRGVKRFAKKFNIPHIHYGLDLWPESLIATDYLKRRNPIFQVLKFYSKKMYESCDYIAFASPSVEDYLRNYLEIKSIPFKQVYQPTLAKKPNLFDVRNHNYCQDNRVRILYCGSIARFHRLDLFIRSIDRVIKETSHKLIIDIVGSGSELDNLQALTKKLGLTNQVNFHGRVSVEETSAFYLNADVLYVPLFNNSATSKMIPQKLIEYLMYNRPIFGMIMGDGRDLLSRASSHNVLSGQDVEQLTQSFHTLFHNKDKFQKCGNENRDFFDMNNRFSIETVCDELMQIITISKKK